MAFWDKKNALEQYRITQKECEMLIEQIARLNSEKVRITAALSGMPPGSSEGSRLERLYEQTEELGKRLTDAREEKHKRLVAILDAVETLQNPRERMIIQYIYIDGLTGEEAAEKLELSGRTIYTEKLKAINNLPEIVI